MRTNAETQILIADNLISLMCLSLFSQVTDTDIHLAEKKCMQTLEMIANKKKRAVMEEMRLRTLDVRCYLLVKGFFSTRLHNQSVLILVRLYVGFSECSQVRPRLEDSSEKYSAMYQEERKERVSDNC